MRVLLILLGAVVFAGCANTEGKLDDLSWSAPVKSDYETIVDRARQMTLRRYPKGLDPDKTNEAKGDFYTVWNYAMSHEYFKSERIRAHVKVEQLPDGKARVGVSVVKQLNDNIDNPDSISEAKWIRTTRDDDAASHLVSSILLRNLEAEPSEYWKEKNRDERRTEQRQDIIDRSKDVDLSEDSDPEDVKHLDPITGGKG